MDLKARYELTEGEQIRYRLAAEKTRGVHLREVTLHYMVNDMEDGLPIVFIGTLSPFSSQYNELELAMIAGYEKYYKGGKVVIGGNGEFAISMTKGAKHDSDE